MQGHLSTKYYAICGMKVLHIYYSVVFAPAVVSSLHAKGSFTNYFDKILAFF